jgi:hypothetical protein
LKATEVSGFAPPEADGLLFRCYGMLRESATPIYQLFAKYGCVVAANLSPKRWTPTDNTAVGGVDFALNDY